jgi:alpha-D-xyloside xylohydrolase
MPYIYSLAGMTWFEDYTIMRPLIMDFLGDKKVENIGDTYMFGPAFLVAPVYEYGARTREVYFPEAEGWYDYYTNKFIAGGQTKTVDAPYGQMPLYVRAGAIVPFGPEIQWTDQKPADVIDLYVYQGADGNFTLYEDENVNYNYEKGAYSMIEFSYNEKMKLLSIEERQGEFPGMLEERVFNIIPVSKDGIGKKQTVKYSGLSMKVVL